VKPAFVAMPGRPATKPPQVREPHATQPTQHGRRRQERCRKAGGRDTGNAPQAEAIERSSRGGPGEKSRHSAHHSVRAYERQRKAHVYGAGARHHVHTARSVFGAGAMPRGNGGANMKTQRMFLRTRPRAAVASASAGMRRAIYGIEAVSDALFYRTSVPYSGACVCARQRGTPMLP